MISPIALNEFKQIWKLEFGTEIPDAIALDEAINLLTVFNAVYRPLKQSEIESYEKDKLSVNPIEECQ